jgi:hypothetical protein
MWKMKTWENVETGERQKRLYRPGPRWAEMVKVGPELSDAELLERRLKVERQREPHWLDEWVEGMWEFITGVIKVLFRLIVIGGVIYIIAHFIIKYW